MWRNKPSSGAPGAAADDYSPRGLGGGRRYPTHGAARPYRSSLPPVPRPPTLSLFPPDRARGATESKTVCARGLGPQGSEVGGNKSKSWLIRLCLRGLRRGDGIGNITGVLTTGRGRARPRGEASGEIGLGTRKTIALNSAWRVGGDQLPERRGDLRRRVTGN